MRKVIHKAIFIWDFDKEQKWLNEMAAKGWSLISVGFCKYEFEECVPGEYKICLQLLDNKPSHPESQKYIEFVEETGAEQVGSYINWIYFRRKSSLGEFEIFSDNDSKIKYISKVTNMVLTITIANIVIGTSNLLIAKSCDSFVNYLGVVNILIGIFGLIGCINIIRKQKKLKQEGQLFE